MSERGGIPLSVAVSAANRNDHREFEAIVDEVARSPGGLGVGRASCTRTRAMTLGPAARRCVGGASWPGIARWGIESAKHLGRHRYGIERTLEWVSRFPRLARRYERKAAHFLGLLGWLARWSATAE